MAHKFSLKKEHKLCSKTAIDKLFAPGAAHRGAGRNFMPDSQLPQEMHSALAYPLRAVWGINHSRTAGCRVQFMISVPKKRLRHAVDRVLMRRRIREAYRLNRPELLATGDADDIITPDTPALDVAFVYVADGLTDYERIHNAMVKLLHKIRFQLR